MFTSRTIFATFLALPFLLTACNSNNSPATAGPKSESTAASTSPAPAAQPTTPDPCKLLTKDEAAAILGEPVRDPEPNNSLGDVHVCDWKSVKLYGGVMPYSVHIAVVPESRKTWDMGKKLHTAKEWQPVAGIGEDAAFELDDLVVYAKGLSININVTKQMDKPDHLKKVQEGERAVAAKAISRL